MACRDKAVKTDQEKRAPQAKVEEQAMKTIRMEEMNWPDIKTAIESGFKTVVIAVGSTEQHGPHLPTMTDARIGEDVAERVARKLGHALLARTIDVGLSEHHLAFAGTISLKPRDAIADPPRLRGQPRAPRLQAHRLHPDARRQLRDGAAGHRGGAARPIPGSMSRASRICLGCWILLNRIVGRIRHLRGGSRRARRRVRNLDDDGAGGRAGRGRPLRARLPRAVRRSRERS